MQGPEFRTWVTNPLPLPPVVASVKLLPYVAAIEDIANVLNCEICPTLTVIVVVPPER